MLSLPPLSISPLMPLSLRHSPLSLRRTPLRRQLMPRRHYGCRCRHARFFDEPPPLFSPAFAAASFRHAMMPPPVSLLMMSHFRRQAFSPFSPLTLSAFARLLFTPADARCRYFRHYFDFHCRFDIFLLTLRRRFAAGIAAADYFRHIFAATPDAAMIFLSRAISLLSFADASAAVFSLTPARFYFCFFVSPTLMPMPIRHFHAISPLPRLLPAIAIFSALRHAFH
jgi:hypothetical protein